MITIAEGTVIPNFMFKNSTGEAQQIPSVSGLVLNPTTAISTIYGGSTGADKLILRANTVDSLPMMAIYGQTYIFANVPTGEYIFMEENDAIFLQLGRTDTTFTTDATSQTAWNFDLDTVTSGIGVQIKLDALANGTGLKIIGDSDFLTTGKLIDVLGGAGKNKSWFKIIKNTGDTETGQVIIDGSGGFGTAAKPNLVFGDADTGFYESADDVLEFVAGGVSQMQLSTTGLSMNNTLTTGALQVQRIFTAINYQTVASDYYVGVNTAGPVQITLATAAVAPGRVFIINDETGNAAIANITVATQAAETIDAAPIATIAANWGTLRVISDGTNWFTW